MRLHARIESDTGKVAGASGNEYLKVDILIGNRKFAGLTVRETETEGEYAVYDTDGREIPFPENQ